MKTKYKLGLLIVAVAMGICLMTYQSYALWVANLEGKDNIVEVGCFNIEFEELAGPIQMKNTYPMSDTKGLSSTPYKFKITNNCSISSKYYVTLNTLTTNQKETFNLKDKIKFAIHKESDVKPNSGTNLGTYATDSSHINTDTTAFTIENLAESIILDTDILNQNESVTYNLYLWYDEAAGNEVMNQKFAASVNILNTASYTQKSVKEINMEYILSKSSAEQYDTDDNTSDHNFRYIGANPNNYVSFNNELWRVIGIMNNVDDGTGKKESRIKLIRNESIGTYKWDDTTENSGRGVNEWSTASLMKLLNPGYETASFNNSLYWNHTSGSCSNASGGAQCDFTSMGLNDSAKAMISDALWYTGTNGQDERRTITTAQHYAYERSDNIGKYCTSGTYCRDNVTRTTKWIGKVGLMAVSDFGYSIGGTAEERNACLEAPLYGASQDCTSKSWIYKDGSRLWTMIPHAPSTSSDKVYNGTSTHAYMVNFIPIGGPSLNFANNMHEVFPTIYLNSNVKITSGEGTSDSPFNLSI